MELETAVRRMFLNDPTVAGYVGTKVYKYRLGEPELLHGTGALAVVVSRDGGWKTPDDVNTGEYPLLVVECLADPSRDTHGEILKLDATDKAIALYRACDQLLHAKGRGEMWGAFGSNAGLRVIYCRRWSEPWVATEQQQLGTKDVPLADASSVKATYACTVVH